MTSAEVSLDDGEVRVSLEEDNRLRLDRLRQVIRDQGFTPRQAEIEAEGIIDRADGGLLFRTPDGAVVLEVSGEPALEDDLELLVGEVVLLRGRVEEPAWGRVHVISVEPASSPTLTAASVPTRSWSREASLRVDLQPLNAPSVTSVPAGR